MHPLIRLKNLLYVYYFRLFYSGFFKSFGKKSRILFPDIIEGAEKISIGSKTTILNNSFLAAYPSKNSELIIGSDCRIGRNNHIYAYDKIEIRDKVLTASNVYISDNTHSYKDYHKAILDQPISYSGKTIIKEGAWIGNNACIFGCVVGKNSVIGANSFVNKDIPDYCIAVGSPAKIIKKLNFNTHEWEKTDEHGNFLP